MNKITYLRSSLEQMSTDELDAMLLRELERDPPDGEAVRMILSVLRQRDTGAAPEPGPITLAAWETYRQRTKKKTSTLRQISPWLLKAVSAVAIVLVLVAALPQAAEASGFLDRLISWTDSIFQLFSPGETPSPAPGYVFKTDNPGLQQVYDNLAQLGVTQPVVPMWLPEGYELTEIKVKDEPYRTCLVADFVNDNYHAVFEIDIYHNNTSQRYCKDDTPLQTYELNGTTYNVLRNKDMQSAVWTMDNLDCSIFIDCPEETLYEILRSIYTMEDD